MGTREIIFTAILILLVFLSGYSSGYADGKRKEESKHHYLKNDK